MTCPRLDQPYAPWLHSSEPSECAVHAAFARATLGTVRRFKLLTLQGCATLSRTPFESAQIGSP